MTKYTSHPPGTVIAVPMKDGRHTLAQIVDWPNKHIVSLVLFRPCVAQLDSVRDLQAFVPFASASVTTEAFRSGKWKEVDRCPVAVPRDSWPNEHTRAAGWVGMRISSCSLVDLFVNAYYGLDYWDSLFEADRLDTVLLPGEQRSSHTKLKVLPKTEG